MVCSAAFLASCSVGRVQVKPVARAPLTTITGVARCLQRNQQALIIAHRGRRTPQDVPESIDSFTKTDRIGPVIMHAGVVRSADNELMILSDHMLDEATTGQGSAATKNYTELRGHFLKDGRGRISEQRIPLLEEAVLWAKRNGGYLMLEPAADVPPDALVAEIRRHAMTEQIIVLAGNEQMAAALRRAAASLLVAQRVQQSGSLSSLQLVGWGAPMVSTTSADAGLLQQAARAGLFPIVDLVSGPRHQGDEVAHVEQGARFLLSDWPAEDWRRLKAAGKGGSHCVAGR